MTISGIPNFRNFGDPSGIFTNPMRVNGKNVVVPSAQWWQNPAQQAGAVYKNTSYFPHNTPTDPSYLGVGGFDLRSCCAQSMVGGLVGGPLTVAEPGVLSSSLHYETVDLPGS